MLLGTFLGLYQAFTLASMVLALKFNTGFFIFLVLVIGLPFAAGFIIKKYRDKNNLLFFPFSMAWLFSMMTFLFASLLSVMLFYLFLRFIDNGQFITNTISLFEVFKEQTPDINPRLSAFAGQMDSYIEYYETLTLNGIIKDLFSTNLLWGNIYSLIIAAFIKRHKIA